MGPTGRGSGVRFWEGVISLGEGSWTPIAEVRVVLALGGVKKIIMAVTVTRIHTNIR